MHSPKDRGEEKALSWPLWITYLILLAVGVPWYWPEGSTTLWFGLPAWAVTAMVASAAISLLTAVALWHPWPGESDSQGEEEDQTP